MTLSIKAYFFNARTDYLPYYKHFDLEMEESWRSPQRSKSFFL